VRHLPPSEHATFFASSRLTLNVTRKAMVEMGWCPSGRLFEASACGAPLLSDAWEGIEDFFEPGSEIVLASGQQDMLAALELDDRELRRIAGRARERTLEQHSSAKRAQQLVDLLERSRRRATPQAALQEA
jgi:spore maturation protein CgeB